TVSRTYGAAAARATCALLEKDKGAPAGVYHCVNSGHCTWLELGREVAQQLGVSHEARIVPVKLADVKLRVRRPQFCALSNQKLRALGIEMPSWHDAVGRYLSDL